MPSAAAILILVVLGVLALCILAMAVGLIFRNKTFSSCACSSVNYKGEKIRCPGCVEPECDGKGKDPAQG